MIDIAWKNEDEKPLGVLYRENNAVELDNAQIGFFDMVTAAMLLHYAKTKWDLSRMISGVARHLGAGTVGRLVAVVMDPDRPVTKFIQGSSTKTSWAGKSRADGAKINVDILTTPPCSFHCFRWKRATYEDLLREHGFSQITWTKPWMNEEGKRECENWREMEKWYPLTILSAIYNPSL